jgi:hypothetical protein
VAAGAYRATAKRRRVRRLKLQGLKARQIIAQGKRSETSAALGMSAQLF